MDDGVTMATGRDIAFVTGAARGIGAEVVRVLAGRGVAVAVAARRKADAEALVAGIAAARGNATAVACDVTDAGSIAAAIAETMAHFGAPTILINNAGAIEPQGLLHETDADAWARNVAVNLIGAAAMARAVLPAMLAAGRGVIVNLSSGAAHRPIRGWSAYCAAKAGLAMLTRSLAEEYGNLGVRIFGFAPGLVDTDMQAAVRAAGVNAVAKTPRDKLAPPRDAAEAIAFLCSPAAASLAGRELDIREPGFRAAAGLARVPA